MKTLLLLLCTVSFAWASPIPEFPFIYVEGEAEESVPTARATISFELRFYAESSPVVEKAFSNASKEVQTMLAESGVKPAAITSHDIEKEREAYDEDDNEDTPSKVYYIITQSFVVEIDDLELYAPLIRKLYATNNVDNVGSSFAASVEAGKSTTLLAKAFANAREKAKAITDAAGTGLGELHSASEPRFSEISHLLGEASSSVSYDVVVEEAAPEDIYKIPPTITHTARIYVLYRLQKP